MRTEDKIVSATSFIENFCRVQLAQRITKEEKFLQIDYTELARFDLELCEDILQEPEETLKCIEIAIQSFDVLGNVKDIKPRITNIPKDRKFLIMDIRSEHIGQMVCVEGIIKGLTQVVGQITSARFECPSCGNIVNVLQLEKIFKQPSHCGCGGKSFRMLSKEKVNAFTVLLEEAPDLLNNANPNLATIQVVFKGDLTVPKVYSKLASGVRILVNGIVVELFKMQGAMKLNEIVWYIDANHLHVFDDAYNELEITQEDEEAIKEFSNRDGAFEQFAEQIFPDIQDLKTEKQILALQAIGGCKLASEGGMKRGDIHIAMVGDSGTAKTQMAKRMIRVAPKGRYVSGGSSTKVGMGAGVERDEILGRHYLVAGALPLSHKGICVIDEFDGFNDEDTKMLNEATEDQEIHINKIVKGTFKTECSVLYSLNPKNGKFDPYATISQQINIKPALLTRCDAILLFKDTPEPERDERIAITILSGKQKDFKPLPVEFIRKYINYVRRINPEVPDDVNRYIAKAFVDIRQKMTRSQINNIPISFRDILSVRRFATALARFKRLNKVTLIEAEKAMQLKMYSLYQVAFDAEQGVIDTGRIATGYTITERLLVSIILEYLNENEFIGGADIEQIYDELHQKHPEVDHGKFDGAVQILKRQGDVYFPKPNRIARL